MDPKITSALSTISWEMIKSEMTGPIDDVRLWVYIIFHQNWKVIVVIGIIVLVWIIRKFRIKF